MKYIFKKSRTGFIWICTMMFSHFVADAQIQNTTGGPEQQEVLRNWSLFSEYYKNQEYRSAIPYGWMVVRMNPSRFRTLFEKLADSYAKLSENADSSLRIHYADTMLTIYELGMKSMSEKAGWYSLQKGFTLERYYEDRDSTAIAAYVRGMKDDFQNVEFYYIDRLGVLYVKNMSTNPEYKGMAVELYRKYLERDPTNPTALDRLKRIIEDPHELIDIALQRLKTDPDSKENIWNTAQAYIQAEEFEGAITYLEKLVKKDPGSETYLTELGKAFQRSGKFRDAINAFERTLKINPDVKENMLNIALCYRELKNFSSARTYAQRAGAKDKAWGRPYIEIAQIYEATVADCIAGTKGGWANMKFDDRLVYKLAQENYARAKAAEPKISGEAETRSRNLETLVPQQEDYFFNKDKIRDGKIAIYGNCYDWIGESITVPSKFQ